MPSDLSLSFHGAVGTVTRLKFLLRHKRNRYLVDNLGRSDMHGVILEIAGDSSK